MVKYPSIECGRFYLTESTDGQMQIEANFTSSNYLTHVFLTVPFRTSKQIS